MLGTGKQGWKLSILPSEDGVKVISLKGLEATSTGKFWSLSVFKLQEMQLKLI